MASKDQQVRSVVEGLAVGLAAMGVTEVTANKIKVEHALRMSWPHWSGRHNFPSITLPDPANMIWLGINNSARSTSMARWMRDGNTFVIDLGESEPQEIASRMRMKITYARWVDLGGSFMEHLAG